MAYLHKVAIAAYTMSTVCTLFTMCAMCIMCAATMLLMYSNNNVIVVQQQQVLGATPLDVSVQQCWDCTAKALLLLCERNRGWWSPPHVLPPALLLSVYTNTNQHCCHCTTATVLVLYSGNRGRAPLPVGPPSCCWSAATAALLLSCSSVTWASLVLLLVRHVCQHF